MQLRDSKTGEEARKEGIAIKAKARSHYLRKDKACYAAHPRSELARGSEAI